MTGSTAMGADIALALSEVFSALSWVRSGVTVAFSLSFNLALAARMRVLKTCGLVGSRTMYPPAESEKRSKVTCCSGLIARQWRS